MVIGNVLKLVHLLFLLFVRVDLLEVSGPPRNVDMPKEVFNTAGRI